MKNQTIITSTDIRESFGVKSSFFKDTIEKLNSKFLENHQNFNKIFNDWVRYFKKIYGGKTSFELFIKHTYYIQLLYAFLVIKISDHKSMDLNSLYEIYKKGELFRFYIKKSEFYKWFEFTNKQFLKLHQFLYNKDLASQDIFHKLYQDIFLSSTRHSIGEFYTPFLLVKEMVKESYEFGFLTLDPSCGSGIFLLRILNSILESDESNESKKEAIKNLYGFDMNPLATFTTKANILLLILNSKVFTFNRIEKLPTIVLMDSLFPDSKSLQTLFGDQSPNLDLVIGNPPWLTYKDIKRKEYQSKIKNLAESLDIKPSSQYITHIELASLFFYASSKNFLKENGIIHLVVPKSLINGDHCEKFRKFSLFKDVEIWDFPNNYFFNVPHICLKAHYDSEINTLLDNFPIPTKIFDNRLKLIKETKYSTYKINEKGAKIILPIKKLKNLNKTTKSPYTKLFYQGATLVPRSLVFFKFETKDDDLLTLYSDPDILSRAKKNWKIKIPPSVVESNFKWYSFLNKDIVPFVLKRQRFVFLPIRKTEFNFSRKYIEKFPKASKFYQYANNIYKKRRKQTSDIINLIDNLNYWNKLQKQHKNKRRIIVYNASGSNIKSTVIKNIKKDIIIGSENYYYSTSSEYEAYYLSGILNSPIMSKNIKLIKSSRHIHKRPFLFPIPLFSNKNEDHRKIAQKARLYHTLVSDIVQNNPNITSRKIRTLISHKLNKLDKITEKVVFNN